MTNSVVKFSVSAWGFIKTIVPPCVFSDTTCGNDNSQEFNYVGSLSIIQAKTSLLSINFDLYTYVHIIKCTVVHALHMTSLY